MTIYACNEKADAISVAKQRTQGGGSLFVFRKFGVFVVIADEAFNHDAELFGEARDGVWMGQEGDGA
jgi:hypothetical protein